MEKPLNSLIINVCAIPDEIVSDKYVSISQSLKTDDTMFVLGNGKFAHMTLFMARFSESEIQNVVEGVNRALKSMDPVHCEHIGYLMTEGRYLESSYRRSDSLLKLHKLLIDNLAQYRINPGVPFEEGYFTPYNTKQQQNAKDTGYDLAYDLYRPHITLTRYAEGKVPESFPMLPEAKLSFNLSKICVYKADDNGAIYEIIKEFNFPTQ